MTQPDISKIQDDLSALLGSDVTADLRTHQQMTDGAGESSSVTVLDLSYREERNDKMRTVRQTALLLEQDDFDLPDFTLRPKAKGLVGKLFKMLGNTSIEFDDSPKFSAEYHLVGWVEPTVRELFVKPIRDHFANDNRWSVCGRGKRLVIYQKGAVVKDADQDDFIKQTLPFLTLFQIGEDALDARPDLRRETRSEDITASVSQMGGIAGAMMARQLKEVEITRSQLEEFAGSSSPRSIPPGMARQVIGQIMPAIAAAIIATLVGIVFGVLCILLGQGNERLIAIPCFMTACLGLVGTWFLNRYRSRKTRVLRDGVMHEGTITDIERTQTKVNDQRRHLVTVETNQTTAVCRAYGTSAKLAGSFKDSGKKVRLLVDPVEPKNTVCLDLLAISEG